MMPKTISKSKPTTICIRSYQVGFGDCFLLTFNYAGNARSRNVLIDFGTTGTPRGSTKPEVVQKKVAEHIRLVCNGKLDAVVATHRHKDHISGFDPSGGTDSSGAIIASLKPSLVVQPWTEDPDAATDAKVPTARQGKANRNTAYVSSLASMQSIAKTALTLSKNVKGAASKQLGFLGENNLANKAAVNNLMQMGKNKYVYFGSRSGLESHLPGVHVKVLGPPTLEQSDGIRKQKSRDSNEFWQLQAATLTCFSNNEGKLFPKAERYSGIPASLRWFTQRMDALAQDSVLELVRDLDNAMNNTSVILLFEVGNKKLLFPGDAQIENWSYALFDSAEHDEIQTKLRNVDFYKVGHHGSLNATPKTLWKLFDKKSSRKAPGRLTTNVSTMSGKHGNSVSGTEVPRKPLIKELEKESDYFSTQDLGFNKKVWSWKPSDGVDAAQFCHIETIPIG